MEFNSPMARQFNGPVIDSLLNARHNIFNDSEEFMLHRQGLTLENATTEELNLIGKFLCMARPYAMVDGEPEYCDDAFYRIYIQNLAILRQSQSIYDLAGMFDQFMPDGRYFVAFLPDGDLLVVIDEQYNTYVPFFQKALNSVFTSLPRINTLESWDFDKFVYQHRLYTRLISLKNSDWVFGVEYRSHACLWLAVGRDSLSGCIVESTDGVNWYKQTNSTTFTTLTDIHYANNKWVAVGYGHIDVSDDGRTWTSYTVNSDLRGVYYHEGLWVVVGGHNERPADIYTSSDTESWTQQDTSAFTKSLIAVSYADGKWIAVGAFTIATSSDGITWQEESLSVHPANYYLVEDIEGVVLVAGQRMESRDAQAVISEDVSDPQSWTDVNYFSCPEVHGICKGDNSYVMVGYAGTVLEGTSVSEWVIHTTGQIDATFKAVAYFNGQWVVVSSQGGIYTSTDLVNWTLHTVENATIKGLKSIACAPIDMREGTYATVVSPSGKLTVNNHIATATIERRT